MAPTLRNPVAVPLNQVVRLDPAGLRSFCLSACRAGGRIAALFALPEPSPSGHELFALVADDGTGSLTVARAALARGEPWPALTPDLPQAQAFERELCEAHGILVSGHPWLKPLRRHPDLEPGRPAYDFFTVKGHGVHEVAVGPVHAGIIEPGHFRFQCHGETVLSLEIHLGYQHRGAEELLLNGPPGRRLIVAESIAGDTAIGHGLAYCLTTEALGGQAVPLGAELIRGIALELERLANHVGDLGALANDVAYLPGASWFGRLRGEFLNLLMELSGNRFGRGLLAPGGARFGLPAAARDDFGRRLAQASRDLEATFELTLNAPSVLSRFERAGELGRDAALELGLVGPAARASGVMRDVRHDHPSGIFRFAHIPVALADTGDVWARALVRWLEVQRSLTFVREKLDELKDGPMRAPVGAPATDAFACALVEGWRGEIVHAAITGPDGSLRGYKVVDPSFHNWLGLAMAQRRNAISDFPLNNKSFNLSYAGHDL